MSNAPIQRYTRVFSPDSSGNNSSYWFDAFGQIAYFFAQLEWSSYAVIDRLGSAGDKARVTGQSGLNFTSRTKLAAQLVKRHLAITDATLADEWSTFWQNAIDKALMRNNILHNPLTVNLHGMRHVGDTEGIKLMKESNAPLLELGEVQAYADELRELNVLMLKLFDRTTFS